MNEFLLKVASRLTKSHASVVFLHGSQGSFLCFVATASLGCVEIFVTLIHVYTYVIYEMKKNDTYNVLVSKD